MRLAASPPLLVATALLILPLGCRWLKGPAPTPSEGEGLGGQGVSPAVTFAEVQGILQRGCAMKCHDGRGTAVDDFVFADDGDLHRRLLNAAPRTVPPPCQNRPLVVPGSPQGSLLMAMVQESEGPRAECAERMPHSCPEKRPCLTADELQSIRLWIEAGAPR